MLKTFEPYYGPHANLGSYTLPIVLEQHKPVLSYASAFNTVAKGMGSVSGSGGLPQYPSAATIDCVFYISPNWLVNNGYGSGTTGDVETALIDFDEWVAMGGLGILTNTFPAGTYHGKLTGNQYGGNQIPQLTHWTATARMVNTFEPVRQSGGTSAQITATFQIDSGLVTLSDGSLVFAF